MEEYLQDIISNMLQALKIPFSHVEIDQKEDLDGDNYYYCNIQTEEASLLIGKQGKNIQAFQHLVKLLLLKRTNSNNETKVVVDVDSYRTRQEESVVVIAEKFIKKLRETGRSQSLPPMTPYFRRVVHLHLSEKEFEDIETSSQGYGDRRHIVINLKKD